MGSIAMGLATNFECDVNYNDQTGKVTTLHVNNATGLPAFAQANLTDGRTFGQTFQQGATDVNFPNNAVTVTFDAQGNPTWVGLADVDTRVPA